MITFEAFTGPSKELYVNNMSVSGTTGFASVRCATYAATQHWQSQWHTERNGQLISLHGYKA